MTLPKFELTNDRAPVACLCLLSEVDMIAVEMVLDVYLLTGISLSTSSAASMHRPVLSHLATIIPANLSLDTKAVGGGALTHTHVCDSLSRKS